MTKAEKNTPMLFGWTKKFMIDHKKIQYDSTKHALSEVGNVMFNLRFDYQWIAETLMPLAKTNYLSVGDARQVLRDKEEIMIQEMSEKLSRERKGKIDQKKILSGKMLTKSRAIEKCLPFLADTKDFLELS
jgi:hypothetical protein